MWRWAHAQNRVSGFSSLSSGFPSDQKPGTRNLEQPRNPEPGTRNLKFGTRNLQAGARYLAASERLEEAAFLAWAARGVKWRGKVKMARKARVWAARRAARACDPEPENRKPKPENRYPVPGTRNPKSEGGGAIPSRVSGAGDQIPCQKTPAPPQGHVSAEGACGGGATRCAHMYEREGEGERERDRNREKERKSDRK